jgi:hypothetical protein
MESVSSKIYELKHFVLKNCIPLNLKVEANRKRENKNTWVTGILGLEIISYSDTNKNLLTYMYDMLHTILVELVKTF